MRKTDANFICDALRQTAHMRVNAEDPRVSRIEDMPEMALLSVVMAHVYRRWSKERPKHGQVVLVRGKDREAEVRLYKDNASDVNWCRFVRESDGHWYAAVCEAVEWMPLP